MTILDRTHHDTHSAGWHVAAWGKAVVAGFVLLSDAFAEAGEMQRQAHRRLPFVDWS